MAFSAYCFGVLDLVEMSCSASFGCQVVGQLNCRHRIRLKGPESSNGYTSWFCGALRCLHISKSFMALLFSNCYCRVDQSGVLVLVGTE